MNRFTAISVATAFAISSVFANSTDDAINKLESKMESLQKEIKQLKKTQKKSDKKLKRVKKTLNKVKAHDAFDNVKFSIDFRNSYNYLSYKYNDYDAKPELEGTTVKNKELFTQRLFLNMKSSPNPKLSFFGKFGYYKTWGGNKISDPSLKEWQEASKPINSEFKIKEAYFVYADKYNDTPLAFSFGRRPSSDGFLANHRENNENPSSPLAHITNMEVEAGMIKVGLENSTNLPGSYVKFVYGKAHDAVTQVNDYYNYAPLAYDYELDTNKDGVSETDTDVDFFVTVASLYNDGQYKLMAQHATIFDTKGQNVVGKDKKVAAGTAYLDAISLEVNGVGDEISDFLDETKVFLSFAHTKYMPDNGYQLLGSTEDETGSSIWIGAVAPLSLGKIGVEYNHGSKYWTPITWAEDSLMGSKVAVRGDAFEVYWNTKMFDMENLTAQLRYTQVQHDYTPSIRCAGWIKPVEVDIEASNFRAMVRYQY